MKGLRNGFWPYLIVIAAILLTARLAGSIPDQSVAVIGEGRGRLIFIDPGHGGEDGGAISVTNTPESAVNLQISLQLRELLRLCGMETAMTREGDYALYDPDCTTAAQKKSSDLRKRAELLCEQPEAILLSIHQNHFPEEQYRGAQVFYHAGEDSKNLAQALQDALREGIDPKNLRQIKQTNGVYLMEHIQNTAVLVECGFLSNREEAALLETPEYQKKLVCGITAGLLRYLNLQEGL